MLRKIILLVLVGILANCSEDREMSPRPFARVETFAVDNITPGSALFSGEITFVNVPVKDHGFLFSAFKDFTATSAQKFSLGERNGPGQFELVIDAEMEQGRTYFVKAYASTEGFTSFGPEREFISLGSEAPVLESLSPADGTWNDVVILRGNNFSRDFRKNKVMFSSVAATVISSSPDTIACRVPMALNASPATVEVSVHGNVTQLEDVFSLIKPEINTISPPRATNADLVTITGKYFNVLTTRLTIGGLPVTPESVTNTTISFRVTQQMTSGVNEVRLYNAEGNGYATGSFQVFGPKVVDIQPLTGTYGDVLTITVEDWPALEGTAVHIGGIEAAVISFQNNQLTVAVPDVMNIDNEIVLHAGPQPVPTGLIFTLLPPSITSIGPAPIISDELTITGSGFSAAHTQVYVDGWQANIIHNTGEVLVVVMPELGSHDALVEVFSSGHYATLGMTIDRPLVAYTEATFLTFGKVMTIGGEIYSIAYSNGPQFFHFEKSTRQWGLVNNVPFDADYADVSFSIGQVLYYYCAMEDSFWAFDQSGSGWVILNNPPFDLWGGHGFSNDQSGYVIGGRDGQTWEYNDGTVWQYDPVNDSWSEKQSAQHGLLEENSFASDGKFSFFTEDGHLAEYIPASDQWNISSTQFDLAELMFFAPAGNDILFIAMNDGKLLKYSIAASQYTHYNNQTVPGFEQFFLRIQNSSKSYFLDSSGRMWELDPDYL